MAIHIVYTLGKSIIVTCTICPDDRDDANHTHKQCLYVNLYLQEIAAP